MGYTLVYDSDCGPCTRFRDAVGFLDARRHMDYLGIAEADRMGILDTIPKESRRRTFHLIFPDGRIRSGAEAIPKLAALIPGFMLVSALLDSSPLALRAAGFVYSVFSRLHESGSCLDGSLVMGARPAGKASAARR